MVMDYPICDLFPDIVRSLKEHPNLVIQAPTGAGKSTAVPICLLHALGGNVPGDQSINFGDGQLGTPGKILLLEPRRLAARLVAERLAENLREPLGKRIGLATRTDKVGGDGVVIEVITEGVLTRRLQSDPGLSGVAVVIFDEFHERNVHTDMGLAFALDCQQGLRDDLRLVVMSATLDANPVARLMGDAPILTSRGRTYPVEERYIPVSLANGYRAGDMARAMAGVIPAIIQDIQGTDYDGDILVFLPGQGEITQTERLLCGKIPQNIHVIPLYGQLPSDKQTLAVRPSPDGLRKIVLSTAVAETSVTIQGITVVVDCGWQRTAQFNPRTGINQLVTSRVTLSSAQQRAGRAGRLSAGVCYRLWSQAETRSLRPHHAPEITVCDVVPLALDLALWGVDSPCAIPLLNKPNAKVFAVAQQTLRDLQLLDKRNRITPLGQQVAKMPLHPRLGRMVMACDHMEQGKLGLILACLLSEPDCLQFYNPGDFDGNMHLRLLAFLGKSVAGATVNKGVLQRVKKTVANLSHLVKTQGCDGDKVGLAIAHAYFDRMASSRHAINPHQKKGVRKGKKSSLKSQNASKNLSNVGFTCVGGYGACLKTPVGQLCGAPYIAIAHMGSGSGRNTGDGDVYLAGILHKHDIEQHFADHIIIHKGAFWSAKESRVVARHRRMIGQMMLSDRPCGDVSPHDMALALVQGVEQTGLHVLPWDKTTRALRQRIQFAHNTLSDIPSDGSALGDGLESTTYPTMVDEALIGGLDHWLLPFVTPSMTDLKSLQNIDLYHALLSLVSYDAQRSLDALLPSHVVMPTGTRVLVDYGADNAPAVAVRIQEVFGLTETPIIAGKPVTMVLLSPAQRPIQVTQDLAGFWQNSYAPVKSEMKGKYPKHYWPDNPAIAQPTIRPKQHKNGVPRVR